jgi:nitrogen regulatory protein P-II 2
MAMKLITAIVRPEALQPVKEALFAANITKMTVSNVIGAGQQGGYEEHYRGAIVEVNLRKKVQIEIAVNEGFVEATIDAIIAGARTGNIGDGKIFIRELEDCVRIRTGERGEAAVG